MLQHSLGVVAAVRSSRSLAATFRFGDLLRNCRPSSLYGRRTRLWLTLHPSRLSKTWMRR
jgi:hypothetical protein